MAQTVSFNHWAPHVAEGAPHGGAVGRFIEITVERLRAGELAALDPYRSPFARCLTGDGMEREVA